MIIPRSLYGGVPIAILQYEGEPADWTPNLQIATFHFPGGNITETQVLGQGDLEAEYLVHLASKADFQALYALYATGVRQTLRVPLEVTAFAGSQPPLPGAGQEHGTLFAYFSGVLLTNMDDIDGPRFDGTVRCRCTFSRAVPS